MIGVRVKTTPGDLAPFAGLPGIIGVGVKTRSHAHDRNNWGRSKNTVARARQGRHLFFIGSVTDSEVATRIPLRVGAVKWQVNTARQMERVPLRAHRT